LYTYSFQQGEFDLFHTQLGRFFSFTPYGREKPPWAGLFA
jgi:hypothetical protein